MHILAMTAKKNWTKELPTDLWYAVEIFPPVRMNAEAHIGV